MIRKTLVLFSFLVVLISCEKQSFTSTNKLECIDDYERIEIKLEDLTTGKVQDIVLQDDQKFIIETYDRPYLLSINGFFDGEIEPRAFYTRKFDGSLNLTRADGIFTVLPYFVSLEKYNDQVYLNWDFNECGSDAAIEAYFSKDSNNVFLPGNKIYCFSRSADLSNYQGRKYFGLKLSNYGSFDSTVVYSDIWKIDL